MWALLVVALALLWGGSLLIRTAVTLEAPFWPGLVCVALAAAVVLLALFLGWPALAWRPHHTDALAEYDIDQNRDFVLYLRSFALDRSLRFKDVNAFDVNDEEERNARLDIANRLRKQSNRELADLDPVETVIQAVLETAFPVVAIGGETTLDGVGKIRTSDENWFERFVEIAERAAVIVCVVYPTTGTIEEIRWTSAHAPERTVYVLLSRAVTNAEAAAYDALVASFLPPPSEPHGEERAAMCRIVWRDDGRLYWDKFGLAALEHAVRCAASAA
jgi:hypothetical protein